MNNIEKNKLLKIIQNRRKLLDKEYKKLDPSLFDSDLINKRNRIQSIINSLNDLENIREYNIPELMELVSKDSFDFDIEKKLREIFIVLKGKYNNKLNISLNEEQVNFLNKFVITLKFNLAVFNDTIKEAENKKNSNMERYITVQEEIINLDLIVDKIRINQEQLTETDFNELMKIIDSEKTSFEDKKNLLIGIKLYNDRILHKEDHLTNVKDIIELIKKYNSNINERVIKKFEDELSSTFDIENAKEIIEFLKEKGLMNEFQPAYLLTLLTYGNIDFIRERYDELSRDGGAVFWCDIPSVWIENNRKNKIKCRAKNIQSSDSQNKVTLLSNAREISYEDVKESEYYLKSLGFKVGISESKCSRVLRTPKYILENNYNIYRKYGIITDVNIKNFPLSTLTFSNTEEKIDKIIELDLFDNYLVNYPSAIQGLSPEALMLATIIKYKCSDSEYKSKLFSETRNGMIKNDFKINLFDKSKEQVEMEYLDCNFIDQSSKRYIPLYDKYGEIVLETDDNSYDRNLLNDEIISIFENKYKKDNYSYVIGKTIISRLKVLRILTKLNGCVSDKEKYMYALTYNSSIDEETFNLIANEIGYTYMEENNGLSGKI